MIKMEIIKKRIDQLIQREVIKVNAEIKEIRQKQKDDMNYYGCGGFYSRYQKAIERRESHISELEALQKAQGTAIILDQLRLYGYYCPTCNVKIYLQLLNKESIDCPICGRQVFRDGLYTEWDIVKGSKYTNLHPK